MKTYNVIILLTMAALAAILRADVAFGSFRALSMLEVAASHYVGAFVMMILGIDYVREWPKLDIRQRVNQLFGGLTSFCTKVAQLLQRVFSDSAKTPATYLTPHTDAFEHPNIITVDRQPGKKELRHD